MDNYESTQKSDNNNNNLSEVTLDINDNEIKNEEIKLQQNGIQDIETEIKSDSCDSKGCACFGYKPSQFKWLNILWLVLIHILAVYAFIYAMLVPVKFLTAGFAAILAVASGFGVSVGAHRLWAHRSFKARWPLRLLLVTLETMAINGGVFSYARDHRNHHKFVDTDADPKNAKRGFFFAHIGWWTVKKRKDVMVYGKKLSTLDLMEDPLVMYQQKFYFPLVILLGIIFPTLTPYFLWNENILTAFLICFVLRTVSVMHHLFTVNSIAHIIGTRPYDTNIGPTESKITMYLSLGEGSHNYHHSFPMDYANCEKKWWEVFNPSTLFVDVCAMLGLAYDLKKPSNEVVQGCIKRKGDPHYFEKRSNQNLCKRISLGAIDWLCGGIVAFWPIWIPLVFKVITGREVFVF